MYWRNLVKGHSGRTIFQKRFILPALPVASMWTSSLIARKGKHPKSVVTPLQDFQNDLKYTATLTIAPWQIPHDSKKEKGGEDTYFISGDGVVMGVFDGVGGWADSGIDPRHYSYALSDGCRKAVDECFLTDPLEILKYGYNKAKGITGSSTACVAVVNGTSFTALNLGDSGFRVIRNNLIILASREQQHAFNMPYQLGELSEDLPVHGLRTQSTLQDGDLIILGSDGLFDNLFNETIVSVIRSMDRAGVQEIAKALAKEAYIISKSLTVSTPFAVAAADAGYLMEGGKEDDITVIVAKYKEMHAKL